MQGLGSVGNRANYEPFGLDLFLRVTSVQWWSKGYFFLAFYVAKGEQNMEDFVTC